MHAVIDAVASGGGSFVSRGAGPRCGRSAAVRRALVGALLGLAVGGLAVAPPLQAADAPESALTGVVNVNTASAEELQLLPGIGSSRAVAIVAMRAERGGFESLEELLDVKGIGPKLFERMRPHLSLTGKTTLVRR